MKQSRLDDGMTAERKLRKLEALTPHERKKLRRRRELEKASRMKWYSEQLDRLRKQEERRKLAGESEVVRKITDEMILEARQNGITRSILKNRMQNGWDPSRAVTVPRRGQKPWTAEEIETVRQAIRENKSSADVCRTLKHRSRNSVVGKYYAELESMGEHKSR